MSKRSNSADVVKRGSQPTASAQLFRLRHAAGLVRKATRVTLAVLTGDANLAATVALVKVSKASALKTLQELRRNGATSVLVSVLGGSLTIGATNLLPLL